MNPSPRAPSPRLPFLDWARGLVAVIMLQGHTFHSMTRKDLQDASPYVFSQFLGGIAPAVFLFLTGVTFGFLQTKNELKEMPAREKWLGALRRAGYLWVLAFAFRLQLWAFALGQSPWTDIFKVDILNCMAMTLTLLSPLSLLSSFRRIQLALAAGLALGFASPVASNYGLSILPGPVADYFLPSYNSFSVLPWGSFAAFGVAFGTILRRTAPDQIGRALQWSAMVGFAVFLIGRYFADFPYTFYSKSEFWLDSPTLMMMKSGIVLMLMAGAYLWSELQPAGRWSWIRQLGTTSLLVYWVHIELIYGRWLGFWKQNLSAGEAAGVAIGLILFMLALSAARTTWPQWRHRVLPRLYAPPPLAHE